MSPSVTGRPSESSTNASPFRVLHYWQTLLIVTLKPLDSLVTWALTGKFFLVI